MERMVTENSAGKYVMERKHKKLFFLALCLIFLATAIVYYLFKKDAYEAGKTKLGKEILVMRDVGGGGTIYRPNWCGNNALLFRKGNIGIELIDFISKKRIKISSDRGDWPLNCTPDGNWAFYYHNSPILDPEYG